MLVTRCWNSWTSMVRSSCSVIRLQVFASVVLSSAVLVLPLWTISSVLYQLESSESLIDLYHNSISYLKSSCLSDLQRLVFFHNCTIRKWLARDISHFVRDNMRLEPLFHIRFSLKQHNTCSAIHLTGSEISISTVEPCYSIPSRSIKLSTLYPTYVISNTIQYDSVPHETVRHIAVHYNEFVIEKFYCDILSLDTTLFQGKTMTCIYYLYFS